MPMYVNQTEISDDAVFREMQYHPAPTREAARDEAAKALLIRELLRQEAVEKGLLADDANDESVELAIMQLLETEVVVPDATPEICRHYYDRNIERFAATKGSKLPLPFDKVEERIGNYLRTQSMRRGVQAFILDAAMRARIAGFDLAATL